MSAASDPRHLSNALSELISVKGLARVRGNARLREAWQEAAGPKIGSQTRVMGLQRGVLQIAVGNAALLSELASFHKASLLDALQNNYADLNVRDLKFRLKGELSQA